MNKFLTTCAVVAIIAAALALLEPALYNDILNALDHFINWIKRK